MSGRSPKEVLSMSVRDPVQVIEELLAGASSVECPLSVFTNGARHLVFRPPEGAWQEASAPGAVAIDPSGLLFCGRPEAGEPDVLLTLWEVSDGRLFGLPHSGDDGFMRIGEMSPTLQALIAHLWPAQAAPRYARFVVRLSDDWVQAGSEPVATDQVIRLSAPAAAPAGG